MSYKHEIKVIFEDGDFLYTSTSLILLCGKLCERKVVVNYGLITRQSQNDGMEKKIEEQIIDVALLPEKHTVVSV